MSVQPSGPYIAEPHDASDPVLRESSVLDQLRLNDTGLAETVTIQSLDGTIEVVSTTIGSDSLVLTSAMQAALTSPTFVTPTLGVAAATQINLSGADATTNSILTSASGGILFARAGNGSWIYPGDGRYQMRSDGFVGWTSGTNPVSGLDSNISRQSAGVIQIGTTANNALGSLACANVTASGTLNVTGASVFATNLAVISGLLAGPSVQASAGGYIYWAGRTSMMSKANGTLYVTNIGETAGVTLDVTTDGTLKIRDRPNTADAAITASNVTASGTVRLGTYTVGTLPSAASNTRARAFVTDSNLAFNSTNLGSTVTAGGSTLVPVLSNGTNWVIG